MPQYHEITLHCDLFGDAPVHVEFTSSGDPDNLELHVTGASVEVHEDKRVITLNAALTRTDYSRPRLVALPEAVFPLIRFSQWDALLDQAQRDRDPMMAGYLEAAE